MVVSGATGLGIRWRRWVGVGETSEGGRDGLEEEPRGRFERAL